MLRRELCRFSRFPCVFFALCVSVTVRFLLYLHAFLRYQITNDTHTHIHRTSVVSGFSVVQAISA